MSEIHRLSPSGRVIARDFAPVLGHGFVTVENAVAQNEVTTGGTPEKVIETEDVLNPGSFVKALVVLPEVAGGSTIYVQAVISFNVPSEMRFVVTALRAYDSDPLAVYPGGAQVVTSATPDETYVVPVGAPFIVDPSDNGRDLSIGFLITLAIAADPADVLSVGDVATTWSAIEMGPNPEK